MAKRHPGSAQPAPYSAKSKDLGITRDSSANQSHHRGPLSPRESVEGMLQVIMGLVPQHNGKFLDYQEETIPW